MKVIDVVSNKPSFKAVGEHAENYIRSFNQVSTQFKESKDASVEAAMKRLQAGKNNPDDVKLVESKITELKDIQNKLKSVKDEFVEKGNLELDKVPGWLQKPYKAFANSNLMKKFAGPRGMAYALAVGNVLKEAVGTTFYTIQALTNEDLPEDKRKFVGMYDLMVGVVSTSVSAIFGLGAVAMQDKILTKALEKNKGPQFSKYAAAYAGLTFLIPNLLQTIICKRIIAPAIATPLAGKWKAEQMAKLEAAKAENKQVSEPETIKVEDLEFNSRGYIDTNAMTAKQAS